MLTEGPRIKEEGTYFKVTGIIHMAFRKCAIFSFPITANHYHYNILDALRALTPFVQFKKREKHQWRSVFHVF